MNFSPWRRYLPLVPIAAVLVAHSLYFNFVCDDAYISFVYARNFAEHGQLVFNLDADPVEGYTNFLWTLLLAVVMKLGIAPEISARILGTAFGIGTLVVTFRLTDRLVGRATPWSALPAGFLALSSGYAAWCSGGLETQMFTFFCVLGIHQYVAGALPRSGLAFAFAALTRPEGILVFGVAVLHRFATNLAAERRLLPRRDEWLWGAAFLAVYAPYFALRWWYYGYPLPNTAYVKTGFEVSDAYAAKMAKQGRYYVWQWASQSKAIWAAPLALLGVWRHPRFGSLVLALTGVYLYYAYSVGGDFMGLHRFVMPLFVTTALLAALGLVQLREWLPRLPAAGAVALAVVVAGFFGTSQSRLSRASQVAKDDSGIDRPGYLKQYADDRALVGKALRPLIRPHELSFVGGVGVQPYYGRMRAFDVFGLVSERVAHEVPPTRPRAGHQKWAPKELVLAHRPTYIFYVYELHAHPDRHGWNSPSEAAWFMARGYEACTIAVPGARPQVAYYSFLKAKRRRDFPCLNHAATAGRP